mmetsp:Transcript_666/g.2238  ORF Transcript_666/g.2238 Transcript_666/m.2238 type:complete len:144 (+) Transcript_666:49-480(+)
MASAQGISELMSAENRASQIVAEARAGASLRARAAPGGDPFHRPPRAARGERMKEAKREAEAVIGKVRAEKEAAFQSSSNETQNQDEFSDMKKVTDAEIAEMQRLFETNKGSVTDMIVKVVTDVSLDLSETRKLAGQRASGQV